jgi:hypothetical protein
MTGPPNFSVPMEISSPAVLFSQVIADTYNVPLERSMAGVPVMPTSSPSAVRP